jgi:hypothetical protein
MTNQPRTCFYCLALNVQLCPLGQVGEDSPRECCADCFYRMRDGGLSELDLLSENLSKVEATAAVLRARLNQVFKEPKRAVVMLDIPASPLDIPTPRVVFTSQFAQRKEPPPLTITPTATPSSCLAEDYERARRDGQHVRVLEVGLPVGACWCGDTHTQPLEGSRDINVITTRPD